MLKFFCLSLLFASFALCATTRAAETKPNILFIFSDDHAQRLIGAYKGSINKTPNLDRIAHEGALFTNSFVTNSICCPSRASILTGKYSFANGVLTNSSSWDTTQWSYPRDIGKAGYQTALIGKWHIKGNPTDEFQHWEILSGFGGQGSYYNPDFISKSGKSKVTGYSTDIITDKALDWLKKRNPSEPFLLCVQYKTPHTPRTPGLNDMASYDGMDFPEPPTLFDDFKTRLPCVSKTSMGVEKLNAGGLNLAPQQDAEPQDPKELPEFLAVMNAEQRVAWHKAYDPRNREYEALKASGQLEGKELIRQNYQRYIKDSVRCIDGLDANIGRLLAYLDESGLSKNTLVIYTSDQGFFSGEHGWAEKRWMYEESFRTPLLMRWPGVITPGTHVDALVQNIDLAPTILQAAGIAVPTEVHGKALQPVLEGKTPPDWRKDLLYTYYEDDAYEMPRHMGVRDERYKLISFIDYNDWEFYDLQKDPQELNNCYNDPAYANEIARLKARLAQYKEELKMPEPPPTPRIDTAHNSGLNLNDP